MATESDHDQTDITTLGCSLQVTPGAWVDVKIILANKGAVAPAGGRDRP